MRRALAFALLALGCNQQTIQTPTRSLDRPSDVALVCAAWTAGTGVVTLPLSTCNTDNSNAGIPNGTGGTATAQLFVLASNTNRGEVALATSRSLPCNVNDANGNPIVCPNQDVCDTRFNRCSNTLGQFTYVTSSIVDLDPRTPGFGFLPVGSLPEHLRATDDGCRAVTANTDGCDLAVIDVARLLATEAKDLPPPSQISSLASRITPRTAAGPIAARPTWIELSANAAAGPSTVATCDAAAKDYRAWVAFPGCELVAEVSLATGDVTRALQVTRDGAHPVDPASVRCPAECAGEPLGTPGANAVDLGSSPPDLGAGDDASAPADDAGAPTDLGAPPDLAFPTGDGGKPPILPTTQAYPHAFALDAAGKRLFIGDATSDRITIIPFDDAGGFGGATSIVLADQPGGVTTLRLSPPIGDDNVVYLYAIARDRSVRVIDVAAGTECETNPDPRWIDNNFKYVDNNGAVVARPADVIRKLRCLPLDGTVPRSALAQNPGISLSGGSLPRDVAFVHTDTPMPVTTGQAAAANPGLLVGDFAWIFDSAGRAQTVNLFDRCPQPNDPTVSTNAAVYCDPAAFDPSVQAALAHVGRPLPAPIDLMPNRLRSANPRFAVVAVTDPTGQPRLSDRPSVRVAGVSQDPTMPPLAADLCNVPRADAMDGGMPTVLCGPEPLSIDVSNFVAFHDPTSVRNETWSLSWEGLLPFATRSTGRVEGGDLVDLSAAYCLRDIEPGDKLYLTGCADDNGCSPSQTCFIDPGSPDPARGMCLPRNPSDLAAAKNACLPWLRAVRRYRVTTSFQNELRFDELAEPEYPSDTRSCTADADCDPVQIPVILSGQVTPLSTACLSDGSGGSTCLRRCTVRPAGSTAAPSPDEVCGSGYACALSRFDSDDDRAHGRGRCLRAPLPDPATKSLCFAELQTYEVHAGDAFLAASDITHLPSPLDVDPATGRCVRDPKVSPLAQPRIPITAPACPPDIEANPLNFQDPAASNSCQLRPTDPDHTFLHFENPVFTTVVQVPITNLFETIDADGGSPDGGAGLTARTRVPPQDTVISFAVVGGYRPFAASLGVDVMAQMPRSSQVAPDRHTVYVVDEGKQTTATGLRGQVIRFFTQTQTSDKDFPIR